MKKNSSSNFNLLALLLILFGTNLLASVFHTRIDLTKEKRYTLSKATKDLLGKVDEPLRIDVFFKGNYPAGFKKIVNSVQEFLQETREYAHRNITIRYSDPLKEFANDSLAKPFVDSMANYYDIPRYTIQALSLIHI